MLVQTKFRYLAKEELQRRLEQGDRDPELVQEVLTRYMRGENQ